MHRPAPLVLIALAAAAVVAVTAVVFLTTRSESSADNEVQGDVDCDRLVGSVDAMHVLKTVAEIPTTAGCIDTAADTDCDDEIDSVDSLRILRYVAQLANSVVAGCSPIGEPLEGTATPAPTPTPTVTPPAGGYQLGASGISTSWNNMLDFALIQGSPGEALVIRQSGQVWKVFLNGSPPVLFGDLDGPVTSAGGEQGLLSLAFSPGFQTDDQVYFYYTAQTCTAGTRCHHLSRVTVTGGEMDESSEVVVLEIPITDPDVSGHNNHNGGAIRFGKDGMLYLSVGDGGGGGDPSETGQDNTDLLGSVLRLDVTGQTTYAVPSDNPFADGGDPGNNLVWAYGFRNPWRMSVDRDTGDIWLGDVGQNAREEVDRVVSGGNYGWDCYEGFDDYEISGCSTNPADYVWPRADYGHTGGSDKNLAVTGGYVYRGSDMPELYGRYVYADAYSGRIWAANTSDTSAPIQLLDTDEFIYSFAEREDGELLVLTASGIYRLAHA